MLLNGTNHCLHATDKEAVAKEVKLRLINIIKTRVDQSLILTARKQPSPTPTPHVAL